VRCLSAEIPISFRPWRVLSVSAPVWNDGDSDIVRIYGGSTQQWRWRRRRRVHDWRPAGGPRRHSRVSFQLSAPAVPSRALGSILTGGRVVPASRDGRADVRPSRYIVESASTPAIYGGGVCVRRYFAKYNCASSATTSGTAGPGVRDDGHEPARVFFWGFDVRRESLTLS